MKNLIYSIIFLSYAIISSCYAQDFIIDVRTSEEFNTGHIENSLNIVHTDILNGVISNKISPEDTIFLYCRSGKRAEFAKKILNDNGYKNVTNLGGYNDALREIKQNTK